MSPLCAQQVVTGKCVDLGGDWELYHYACDAKPMDTLAMSLEAAYAKDEPYMYDSNNNQWQAVLEQNADLAAEEAAARLAQLMDDSEGIMEVESVTWLAMGRSR